MGSIKLCLIIIIIFSFADLLAVPEFIFRQNVALASSGAERAGGLFENIRVVPQTFTDGFIDGLEVMREKANIAQASLAYFFSGFGESINNFTSIFSVKNSGSKNTGVAKRSSKEFTVKQKETVNNVVADLPIISAVKMVGNIMPVMSDPAENSGNVKNNTATAGQQIYNTYNPIREVIRTNTIIEKNLQTDDDLAKKVAQIMLQMDSDRPNFSLGQNFGVPKKISGETLNIGSGSNKFLADKNGNLTLAGQITIGGGSPGAGKVLTSDANGLAAWQVQIANQWVTTANDIYYLTGNVGIGTTAPGSTMDVKGNLRLSGATSGYVGFMPAAIAGSTTYTLPSDDGNNGEALVTNGLGTLRWASVGGASDHGSLTGLGDDDHTIYALLAGRSGGQTITGGTGTTDDLFLKTTSGVGATGADMHFLVGNNGGTEAMTILNSGYVGIGAASNLDSSLTVNGPAAASAPFYYNIASRDNAPMAANIGGGIGFEGNDNINIGRTFAIIQGAKENSTGGDYAGYLRFFTRSNGSSPTERMRITSGGNVGIGTTAPDQALVIKNPGNGDTNLVIDSQPSTSYDSNLLFRINGVDRGMIKYGAITDSMDFRTAGTSHVRMTINNSGNVGIGTTAPASKLHIVDDTLAGIRLDSGTRTFLMSSYASDSNYLWAYGANFSFGTAGADSDNFYTNGAERMRITSDGNVGIGTTAPLGKLDVSGSSASTDATVFVGSRAISIINTDTTANNMSGFDFRTNDASSTIATGAKIMGVYTSHAANAVSGDLTFITRNVGTISEKMRILANGNVGVGTVAPSNAAGWNRVLEANGTATSRIVARTVGGVNIMLGATETANFGGLGEPIGVLVGTESNLPLSFVTNGTTKMVILSDGKIGIGTTAPTYQLQLSTDSAAKPTSNTWTVPSDIRLKKDITPFTDGLNVINRINPINYVLNGKGGMPENAKGIGVIAQDIKDIAPYTVSTFKAKLNADDATNTELYSFDSSSLTFVAINAIKELDAKVDTLQLKLNENGLLDSTSTLEVAQTDTSFAGIVSRILREFGLALENGVATAKEFVADKVTAKQICIKGDDGDEICVSKDQLKKIIQDSSAQTTGVSVPAAAPVSVSGSLPDSGGQTTSGQTGTALSATGGTVDQSQTETNLIPPPDPASTSPASGSLDQVPATPVAESTNPGQE